MKDARLRRFLRPAHPSVDDLSKAMPGRKTNSKRSSSPMTSLLPLFALIARSAAYARALTPDGSPPPTFVLPMAPEWRHDRPQTGFVTARGRGAARARTAASPRLPQPKRRPRPARVSTVDLWCGVVTVGTYSNGVGFH